MGTLFTDYEVLVLSDYHQKKVANVVSLNLLYPTPAKLKAECINVCMGRFLKKDEKAIRDFFGQSGDQRACLQAIQRFETDKFKPLVNFLKGNTEKTEEKNIQLLAWLIDFADRPYEFGKKYATEGVALVMISPMDSKANSAVDNTPLPDSLLLSDGMGEVQTDTDINTSVPDPSPTPIPVLTSDTIDIPKKGIKFGPRQTLAAATVLVGISMAFLFLGNERVPPGGCMYWTGDRYQAIPCTEKIKNALIVALDTAKVNHFRRITLEDTITRNAIGAVWYSKINNEIEYFTSGGYHPVVTGRRLKPLSLYMYEKYIDTLTKPH